MGHGYKGPEWDEVKVEISARAEECQAKLKTPRLDHQDTQFYRGALWILEELSELDQKRPAPVVETGPGYWPDTLE